MNDAQRWILSLSCIIVLEENPGAFEALAILGAQPRPRSTAWAVVGLSDAWGVTSTAQLETEFELLMATEDGEPGFDLARAADLAQNGYAAYLITRETAWAWLLRVAVKAQAELEDFRAFAESYRRGAEERDDEDELEELDGVIALVLTDPRSPWVSLAFDMSLNDVEMPQQTARSWRVTGTINATLAAASDGDRIVVPAGTYRERIRVSTPEWDSDEVDPLPRAPSVEIVGEGRVVITHDDGPVILVADGGLVLEGIRIENDRATLADPEDINGDVARVIDGSLRLVRCDVSARAGRGIVIFEAGQLVECGVETGGFPAVLSTRVVVVDRSAMSGGGLILTEEGEGFMEDCKVVGSKYSGLEARDSAVGTAQRCVFQDCVMAGAVVFDKGVVQLSHCELTGNTYAGFAVQSGRGTASDCKMTNNVGNGARYEGRRSHGALVRCELRGNHAAAIFMLDHASVTVAQSTAESHGSGGGVVIQEAKAHISSTTILGSEVNAVEIRGKCAPTFSGCTIRGNGGEGVLVDGGAKPRISKCTIKDGAQSGVFIQDGQPHLTDCEISGHQKVGVVSEKGSGAVIRCKIHHNKAFAIQAGARLSVRDCELNDNAEDGVYVHGEGDVSVERCEIARNGDCNVRLFEGHARLVGCKIHHAKSSGVFLEGECKVDIDACDLSENGEEGLHVMGSCKASVKRSHFHANGAVNVLVQEHARATVSDSAMDDLRVDGSGGVSLQRTLVRRAITKSRTAKVTQKDCITGQDLPFALPKSDP